jgi:hypothetical protein
MAGKRPPPSYPAVTYCLPDASCWSRSARNWIRPSTPLSIWIDLFTNEFVTEIQKVTDGTNILSKEELHHFTADAEQLAQDLDDSLSGLWYPAMF